MTTERGDPAASSIMGGALHTARSQGFLNTVITAAPQVTSYVVEHTAQLRSDPFIDQLVAAALEVRATQPGTAQHGRAPAEPLTAAEQHVLALNLRRWRKSPIRGAFRWRCAPA
jgi:hypothetical protein